MIWLGLLGLGFSWVIIGTVAYLYIFWAAYLTHCAYFDIKWLVLIHICFSSVFLVVQIDSEWVIVVLKAGYILSDEVLMGFIAQI